MSLSSALFSGISGMNTLGNSMTVIGDNIANVSTVGFKASRVTFQDVLAQTVSTQSGTGQLGRGSAMGDITGIFSQGSLESTDSPTDLAIGGEGFFVVRDPEAENLEYFTRAGEFRFDQDGNFVNPPGYIVRGWSLDEDGNEAGTIGDIILNSFTSPPEATDKVSVIANLDSDGTDNSYDPSAVSTSLGAVSLSGDVVNHPIYLTLNNSSSVIKDVSQFEVTWTNATSTWSITHGADEYATAVITGDASGFIIDLDNDGTTDITGRTGGTLTADGAGAFDIVSPGALGTVTQGGDAANNNVSLAVSDPDAFLTHCSGFQASWDNATTTWSITSGATQYPLTSITGNATSFEIDLDGNGTTDISGSVAGAGLVADATATFDIYPPNGMLSQTWDATESTPLGDGDYEYQAILKVYDSLGSTHDLGVYYDKGDSDNKYEFIVTCDPNDDKRGGGTTGLPAVDSTIHTGAGMLARGLITFSSDGHISSLDMWKFETGGTNWNVNDAGNWDKLDPNSSTDISSDGFFSIAPSFTQDLASSMELNLGLAYDGASWTRGSLATTQFASACNTTFQTTTGYGVGDLDGISVTSDGVITGQYSNGQIKPLFRIALAKFNNVQGLQKMGKNVFAATRLSGDAITNKPGTNGLGTITSNALEQSNVDLANEFVKMITTQRGYQANSKVITVTDQLLQEVINLKR